MKVNLRKDQLKFTSNSFKILTFPKWRSDSCFWDNEEISVPPAQDASFQLPSVVFHFLRAWGRLRYLQPYVLEMSTLCWNSRRLCVYSFCFFKQESWMLMVSNGEEKSSAQQFHALGQVHALVIMRDMPCSADAIAYNAAYSNSFIKDKRNTSYL